MRRHILKPVRIKAGLGNPYPERFSTNRVESINSLLKLETNGSLPVDECVKKIRELVNRQKRNIENAIIGKGPYDIHPNYKSVQVDEATWMTLSEVHT